MKKTLFLIVVIIGLSIRSFATVHVIAVGNYTFSPTSVTAVLGDTIKWVWSNGSHNTTNTSVIPVGAATWASPLNSSVTSFIYVPAVTGTYNYECTFHVSMGMTGSFMVGASGVGNVSKTDIIKVYPNPASETLHIQFNASSAPVSLTLTDMNGVQVIKKKYRVFKNDDLDLQDVPNGTYILHAVQGNDAYDQQILISH